MVKMRQRNLAVFEFEQGTQQEILAYIQSNLEFMRNRCLAFHFDVDTELEEFLHNLQIDFFKVCNKNLFKTKNSKLPLETIESNSQNIPINLSQDIPVPQTPTKKIKITFDSTNEENVVMQTFEDNNTCLLEQQQEVLQDFEKKIPLNSGYQNNNIYPSVVFKRAIRRGEELILESHTTFLKNINFGATIKSYGNLQIYGKCDGILECLGDFIIIKEFSMGRISLQGIDLEGKVLEEVQKSQKLKMLVVENNQIIMIELS